MEFVCYPSGHNPNPFSISNPSYVSHPKLRKLFIQNCLTELRAIVNIDQDNNMPELIEPSSLCSSLSSSWIHPTTIALDATISRAQTPAKDIELISDGREKTKSAVNTQSSQQSPSYPPYFNRQIRPNYDSDHNIVAERTEEDDSNISDLDDSLWVRVYQLPSFQTSNKSSNLDLITSTTDLNFLSASHFDFSIHDISDSEIVQSPLTINLFLSDYPSTLCTPDYNLPSSEKVSNKLALNYHWVDYHDGSYKVFFQILESSPSISSIENTSSTSVNERSPVESAAIVAAVATPIAAVDDYSLNNKLVYLHVHINNEYLYRNPFPIYLKTPFYLVDGGNNYFYPHSASALIAKSHGARAWCQLSRLFSYQDRITLRLRKAHKAWFVIRLLDEQTYDIRQQKLEVGNPSAGSFCWNLNTASFFQEKVLLQSDVLNSRYPKDDHYFDVQVYYSHDEIVCFSRHCEDDSFDIVFRLPLRKVDQEEDKKTIKDKGKKLRNKNHSKQSSADSDQHNINMSCRPRYIFLINNNVRDEVVEILPH
jgi:hypothetical protein